MVDVHDIDTSLFCSEEVIWAADFVAVVREATPDEEAAEVAIAESLLSRCVHVNRFQTLVFGECSLDDAADKRVFDVLVSHPHITMINLFDEERLPGLLSRALPRMTNLRAVSISWSGIQVSTLQANRIFNVFKQCIPSGRPMRLVFDLAGLNESAVNSSCKFIRESTQIESLSLGMADSESSTLSATLFDSFCLAVGECSSPGFFLMDVQDTLIEQGDSERAAESLAHAIVKNETLSLLLLGDGQNGAPTADQIGKALLQTPAVKNFDLCYHVEATSYCADTFRMAILRNNSPYRKLAIPWKPLLALDLPLSLWPLVLEKANLWKKQQASHSALDALFFLMKEKCDVLLQNVHRRRIRKRKRFQFET